MANGMSKIDEILKTPILEVVDDNFNVSHMELTNEEDRKVFDNRNNAVQADKPERLTSNTIPTDEEAAWMGEGWSIDEDGDRFDPYDPDGFGDD